MATSRDELMKYDADAQWNLRSLPPLSSTASSLAGSVATISKIYPESISFLLFPRPGYHSHFSPGQCHQIRCWCPRAQSCLPRFSSPHTARAIKSNRDHRLLTCLNIPQTSSPFILPIAQMLAAHWPPFPSKLIPTPGPLHILL